MIKFFLVSLLMACASPLLLPSDTLSPKKVEGRWGKSQFSTEAFKNGTIDDRAKMAADLISKKELFLKKNANEVRALLGTFSGHYFSESYPTYLIHRGSEKEPESWQLLFLIDRKNQVKDIVVHKNCCRN